MTPRTGTSCSSSRSTNERRSPQAHQDVLVDAGSSPGSSPQGSDRQHHRAQGSRRAEQPSDPLRDPPPGPTSTIERRPDPPSMIEEQQSNRRVAWRATPQSPNRGRRRHEIPLWPNGGLTRPVVTVDRIVKSPVHELPEGHHATRLLQMLGQPGGRPQPSVSLGRMPFTASGPWQHIDSERCGPVSSF